MLAKDFVNHVLPVLKPSDTVADAMDWMEEFRVGQLVIVDGETYKGLVSHDGLVEHDEDTPLEALQMDYSGVYVTPYQHLFEILSLTQQHALEAVAVINEDGFFEGTIVVKELLDEFAKSLGTQELGAVVEIAVENRSYSLSEISRLIESNDTKIISSYYSSGNEHNDFKSTLTLKLNRKDISHVVATLERFEYEVVAAYAFEAMDSPDKERYELLMKYLTI
jgi:acetoin utilization protein AcuB